MTSIQTTSGPLPAAGMTLLRSALVALGTILMTWHIIPASVDLNVLVGAEVTAIAALWEAYKTHSLKSIISTLLPDAVAVVEEIAAPPPTLAPAPDVVTFAPAPAVAAAPIAAPPPPPPSPPPPVESALAAAPLSPATIVAPQPVI